MPRIRPILNKYTKYSCSRCAKESITMTYVYKARIKKSKHQQIFCSVRCGSLFNWKSRIKTIKEKQRCRVAQLVEQRTVNAEVAGSSPALAAKLPLGAGN